MSTSVNRGDGVGIEVAHSIVRGVRLRHDVNGRLAAATELPANFGDDTAALDALVLLHAELGEPVEPTRLATFPNDAMLQRIDITGRSGPELNELRATLDQRHSIDSTVVVDDGPRRWLLVIRWDSHAVRRLEDLAERAGFVDVTIEPSPMALARVAGIDATAVRRLVAQGESYHAVVSNRVPVAALSVSTTGRPHPDLDISRAPLAVEQFDDFMPDGALSPIIESVMDRAFAQGPDSSLKPATLDIAGQQYPGFPEHDHRSAQRQAVAIGAAIGASGLAGPLRVVDMLAASAGPADNAFDRPWAIEALSTLPDVEPDAATGGVKRLTRHLRPRNRR